MPDFSATVAREREPPFSIAFAIPFYLALYHLLFPPPSWSSPEPLIHCPLLHGLLFHWLYHFPLALPLLMWQTSPFLSSLQDQIVPAWSYSIQDRSLAVGELAGFTLGESSSTELTWASFFVRAYPSEVHVLGNDGPPTGVLEFGFVRPVLRVGLVDGLDLLGHELDQRHSLFWRLFRTNSPPPVARCRTKSSQVSSVAPRLSTLLHLEGLVADRIMFQKAHWARLSNRT